MSTYPAEPSNCVVSGDAAHRLMAAFGWRRIEAVQDGNLQNAGWEIGRHMGGVIVDPVGNALVVDAEQAADLTQTESFQVKAEGLQAHFFVVPFFFGEWRIACAAGPAAKALAASRGTAVSDLLIAALAARALNIQDVVHGLQNGQQHGHEEKGENQHGRYPIRLQRHPKRGYGR